MFSFVVPAHNEEAWISRCVSAVRSAMEDVGEPYETIVVDDASTDATATLAQRQGAEVVRVERRQISAARNAGARHARGDVLFFVDADTLVNAAVIRSAFSSMRFGAVGGGCVPRFEGSLPLWWKLAYPFAVGIIRLFRLPGGACQFCTRAAFAATNGFSERHYAAEDALFIKALKRCGKVVVPAETVITSGRSLRSHSFMTIARLLARLVFQGADGFRDRQGLEVWYGSHRERS
jgi:glycosyltransferase involved in cell wall biosynthesis